MTRNPPLVSCIMPVRHRRRFVLQAIEYFLRQNYPAKELIIVDDGDDQAPIPGGPGIRYIRLDSRRSIGEKRNVACGASRGDLIAHWDDDTWQAPDRLTRQVDGLLRSGADACGSRDLCYLAPTSGLAWRKRGGAQQLAETTLMYRRACWERSPFIPAESPRARPVLAQIDAPVRCPLPDPPVSVGYMHPGNPDGFNLHDPSWERHPIADIARVVAPDWGFYAEMRTGVPRAPTAPPAAHPLTVGAHYLVADGYGSMAEYLVLGMDRAGVAVNPLPYSLVREGLTSRFLDLADSSRPNPDATLLHYSPVDSAPHHQAAARDVAIYSMWESDRLPGAWLPALHRAQTVIVPTRWCADLFRNHGVRAEIAVVPDGIDPDIYAYAPRIERPGLTTLMVGVNVGRKHFREGIAAWKRTFATDPDARLLLKTHHQHGACVPDDPRITCVQANETSRGIAHWYRQADVFLALGNEGFGLPLIEAMACGLPVIALDSEGQGDMCRDAQGLLLPVPAGGREPHYVMPYGRCGTRAVPSVEAISAHLTWVATHREEAAEMGRAASRWVLEHRNVWDKGPAVLEAIERHVSIQRTSPRLMPARSATDGLATAP